MVSPYPCPSTTAQATQLGSAAGTSKITMKPEYRAKQLPVSQGQAAMLVLNALYLREQSAAGTDQAPQ